jgi:hypothetical protein
VWALSLNPRTAKKKKKKKRKRKQRRGWDMGADRAGDLDQASGLCTISLVLVLAGVLEKLLLLSSLQGSNLALWGEASPS